LGFLYWGLPVASAFSGLQVSVEVIKADRTSNEVDPQLEELVKELAPVLSYTSFTLLKKSMIRLNVGGKDELILSSDRLLQLELLGLEEKQARLSVKIVEKGEETFRTVILLVDKGSVLIGGPPHEGGVLLLRIGGEFRG
jgi:hypothetical protein